MACSVAWTKLPYSLAFNTTSSRASGPTSSTGATRRQASTRTSLSAMRPSMLLILLVTRMPSTSSRLPPTLISIVANPSFSRCHSGELFYVFGSLPTSLPYRDGNDLPFMQMSMDTWTSFARTYNPNPDPAFLRARGFTTSAANFAKQSKWEAVTKNNLNGTPLRVLEFPSKMDGFRELSQCDLLGFSLNHFG